MRIRSPRNKDTPLNYIQKDNYSNVDAIEKNSCPSPQNDKSYSSRQRSSSRKMSKVIWLAYLTSGEYSKFMENVKDFSREEVVEG